MSSNKVLVEKLQAEITELQQQRDVAATKQIAALLTQIKLLKV